jgi:hypothetical protein
VEKSIPEHNTDQSYLSSYLLDTTLVVFPLKGLAVDPKLIVGGLIVNGAWALGLALIMRGGLQKF